MQKTLVEEPIFESGAVLLSTGDVKVLEVNLTSKKITVDVEDKAFLKRAIALRGEIGPPNDESEPEQNPQQKKSGGALSMLKTVAEALSKRGITLEVSYKGKKVATVGAEAKPTLLQLITKTRAVELNSLLGALRMIL
jgi:hypothetical protein